jgi:hypothetical protein
MVLAELGETGYADSFEAANVLLLTEVGIENQD